MPQFYLNITVAPARRVQLNTADSHHVVKVLRWTAGRGVRVVDSSGSTFDAVIANVDTNGVVEIDIQAEVENACCMPRLDVAQAVLALSTMDDVVKAASECGARTLIPFFAKRSTAVSVSRFKQRVERLERVILSAAKQSGRNVLLELGGIVDFSDMESLFSNYDICVFGSLNAKNAQNRNLSKRFSTLKNPGVLVLVGPEGGFTSQEEEIFCSWGALPINLGPVTLRAQNAVTAAASVINWELSHL